MSEACLGQPSKKAKLASDQQPKATVQPPLSIEESRDVSPLSLGLHSLGLHSLWG